MKSSSRTPRIILLSVACILSTIPAFAKHVHVPKRCPVKAHAVSDATVFSSPDAQDDVQPGFVGKKGQPLNSEMDRMYTFDPGKLLGNLDAGQKKYIKNVEKTTNAKVREFQDSINALDKRVDASEIADLRKRITETRKESIKLLEAVLTKEQLEQLQRMRHGEFVLESPKDIKTP